MWIRCCEERERVPHGRDPRGELLVVDDGLEVGVVEEVAQLLLDVAEVHVHRHGPDLVGRQRGLDPLDAVGAVDADVVAGPDALGEQVVGELVGPRLRAARTCAAASPTTRTSRSATESTVCSNRSAMLYAMDLTLRQMSGRD